MSHYEEAVRQIPQIEAAISSINHDMGKYKLNDGTWEYDSRIDKHGFTVFSTKDGTVVLKEMHHGWYGNSSCSFIREQLPYSYLAKAIDKLRLTIQALAIEIAQDDIKKLKERAASEARSVLEGVA